MAEDKTGKGIGRRGFFGAAAAVATGAVLTKGGATPAFAQQTGDERTKARYRESEQVLAFYRTNRYYQGE